MKRIIAFSFLFSSCIWGDAYYATLGQNMEFVYDIPPKTTIAYLINAPNGSQTMGENIYMISTAKEENIHQHSIDFYMSLVLNKGVYEDVFLVLCPNDKIIRRNQQLKLSKLTNGCTAVDINRDLYIE